MHHTAARQHDHVQMRKTHVRTTRKWPGIDEYFWYFVTGILTFFFLSLSKLIASHLPHFMVCITIDISCCLDGLGCCRHCSSAENNGFCLFWFFAISVSQLVLILANCTYWFEKKDDIKKPKHPIQQQNYLR